jgi:hypothetical protein
VIRNQLNEVEVLTADQSGRTFGGRFAVGFRGVRAHTRKSVLFSEVFKLSNTEITLFI